MKLKKTPLLQQGGTANASEWLALAERLARVNRAKHNELLAALRRVVEIEETGEGEMPRRPRRCYLV